MPFASNRVVISAALSVVVVLGVAIPASAQSDGVQLNWRYTVGQTTRIEMSQDMGVQMNVGGNAINTKSTNNSYMTWTVKEVDSEGTAKVDTVIDRMTLSMQGPGGNVQFDTDDEEDAVGQAQQMATLLRPMVGVTMNQTMHKSGEITDVQIPDEIKNAMQSIGPNGAAMLETMSKNAALQFPEKPLQIGDHWTKKIETPSPAGKMTVQNTYTYKGLADANNKSLHEFDVDMKMEFAEGAGPAGSTIKILNQDTDGKLYFDADKGRIDHSSVKQNLQMNISVAGQNLQQTLTQDIEVRFVEANASQPALR